MTLEQLLEIRAIETCKAGSLRHRSGALHEVHEVAALVFRCGLSLGLGQLIDGSPRIPRCALFDRCVVGPALGTPADRRVARLIREYLCDVWGGGTMGGPSFVYRLTDGGRARSMLAL